MLSHSSQDSCETPTGDNYIVYKIITVCSVSIPALPVLYFHFNYNYFL